MSDELPQSKFGAGHTYSGPSSTITSSSASSAPAYGPNPASHATPFGASVNYPAPQLPGTGYGSTAPSGSSPASATAPAYGSAPSWVPVAPAPAGGGAAITAGVLALLIGLFRGLKTYIYFVAAQLFSSFSIHNGGAEVFCVVATIASAIGTLALIIGAVMLFNRNNAGRGWITIGCLIAIADVVVTWLAFYVFIRGFGNWFSSSLGGVDGMAGDSLASSVFSHEASAIIVNIALAAGIPLLTMLLALSSSARRWCNAKHGGYIVAAVPGQLHATVTPPFNAAGWNQSIPHATGYGHAQAAQHLGAHPNSPTAPPGPISYPAAQAGPANSTRYGRYSTGPQQDSFVTRLMERGVLGDLFRQPWFQDLRGRSPDPFVIGSYVAGVVIGILLAQIPSIFAATILSDALWAAIGYLYFAVGTKLAHQFLLFGICLVGSLVMLGRVWSALEGLSTNHRIAQLYSVNTDPSALLLLDLILNAAGVALLVYVGLQVHRGIQRLSA